MDWDADRRERRLGKAGHEEFVRAFILHRGSSAGQVEEVIDNKNNGPLLRRIRAVRQRRDATLRRLRGTTAPVSAVSPLPTLSVALADDIDLEFVLIPAGEFLMWSPTAEENPTESLQQLVRIPHSYNIGRFPVAQVQ